MSSSERGYSPNEGRTTLEMPIVELPLLEVERLGPLAIAYGAWGTFMTQTQIFEEAGVDNVLDRVAANGFTGGYHFPREYDVSTPEAQYELALNAAQIGLTALKARGWDDGTPIQIFFGSTSAQPVETAQMISEILQSHGVVVRGVQERGFACGSALVGLIDGCLDPALHGQKTLIIGAETLSGQGAADSDFRATFSNGGSAMAVELGTEIEVIEAKVRVMKDPEESVRLPAINFEYPPDDGTKLPSHYEIIPGATVHVSSKGIYQEFLQTENTSAWWNPRAMGVGFKKNLPPLPDEVVANYAKKHDISHLQRIVPVHQANKSMVDNIINGSRPGNLNERLSHRTKNGSRRQKPVKEPFQINAPWVMDQVGMSNVSAATTFIVWAYLAKTGQITPDIDLLSVGYGIGLSVAAGVFRIHSPQVK